MEDRDVEGSLGERFSVSKPSPLPGGSFSALNPMHVKSFVSNFSLSPNDTLFSPPKMHETLCKGYPRKTSLVLSSPAAILL